MTTYSILRRNRRAGEARDITLIGCAAALLAGMATGAQALLLVSNIWQSPPAQGTMPDLLPWAAAMSIPDDRDRSLYLLGILLSSALGSVSVWAYCRPAGQWIDKRMTSLAGYALEHHLLLLVPPVSLATQWVIVFLEPSLGAFVLSATVSVFVLLADAAAVGIEWLLAAPLDPDPGPAAAATHAEIASNCGRSGWFQLPSRGFPGLIPAVGHTIAVLAVVILLYVPDYRSLTGQFLDFSGFHHWDFFAVAPTHAYLQGLTPVLESVTQYGLGIPVILGNVFKVTGNFSYVSLIWLSMVLVICYYVGLYFLLWRLLGHFRWSVIGLILALVLQQFAGTPSDEVLLMAPSSTILRAPLDVAVFITLALHSRHLRWRYLALGGVLVGLATFWETDTGFYLYAGYVAYCTFLLIDRLSSAGCRGRTPLGAWLAATSVPPLVFACLVLLAVGGNALDMVFWQRFLEPMRRFSSGFGMLPMPSLQITSLPAYLAPAVYVASCVAALASATRLVNWRWEGRYLMGSVGAYGLTLYNQYIGRSHAWNWYHVSIPLVILLTLWAYLLHRKDVPGFRGHHYPTIMLCALLVLVAFDPWVRAYPNVLANAASTGGTVWDVPGAGFRTLTSASPNQGTAMEAVERIQRLIPPGGRVLILSDLDTLYYVLADRRPLTRFVPLYPQVTTQREVDEVLLALSADDVRYVFTEPCRGLGRIESPWCSEFQSAVLPFIERQFTCVERTGGLSVWQRVVD